MTFRQSILLVPFLILSLSHLAYSETIYKWVDKQGNTHFTTIYESIPAEYRNGGQKPDRAQQRDKTREAPIEQRTEEADTTEEAPIQERAEAREAPSVSQPKKTLRKAEKRRRPKFEIEGRYWITDLDGEIRYTDSGIGTKVDFEEDLGLDDEGYPELRVSWLIGPKSRLRLAYTQTAYSGDGNINQVIVFGGETFPVGTRVKTDVDVKYLRLGWVWQFINVADGRVKIGTLVEVKGFSVDISLDAPDLIPPIKESVDAVGAFPTVGVVLDIHPHKLVNIFAEASGIYAGKYGYSYDAEAGVEITPIKNLGIIGGWRILDFKIEDDPDFAKLKVSGPYVGAVWRF